MRRALDAIVAHARAAQPEECCGLLVGASRRIDEAVPARNLAGSPSRFLLDPRDHIEARRRARSRGREVIGFYHSHPNTAAWPSPADIAEATYDEAVHVIVSLAGSEAEARAFTIARGTAVELPLEEMPLAETP